MISKVSIIGAGGHAREINDIFADGRRGGSGLEVVGFIDDYGKPGDTMCGLPILGGFEWLESADPEEVGVITAIGTPSVIKELVVKVRGLGLHFVSAISPRAWVSPGATIGEGVVVFPHVFVSCNATLGSYTTLNVAATVSHDACVGDFCVVSPGAHLAGNVTLGEGCFVGMGCNIIQGRTVGGWSVLGAGAVVIDDIPPHVTAAGVPAHVINHKAVPFPPRTSRRGGRTDNVHRLGTVHEGNA